MWWDGHWAQWIAEAHEGEELDLEVAQWGRGCAAWSEAEEGFVVVVDVETDKDGKEKSERSGEEVEVGFVHGWEVQLCPCTRDE